MEVENLFNLIRNSIKTLLLELGLQLKKVFLISVMGATPNFSLYHLNLLIKINKKQVFKFNYKELILSKAAHFLKHL